MQAWKDNALYFVIAILIGEFFITPAFANSPYVPLFDAADLGVARAGNACIAQDASTNYSNPAGLMRLRHQQISISAIGVTYPSNFKGRLTTSGLGVPVIETGKATSDTSGVLPNFYYSLPLSPHWATGISITEPYALGLDYPPHSIVRYEIIKAKDESVDIGPNLAYRINQHLSIGAGPDLFYFYVTSKIAVRTQPLTFSDSLISAHESKWQLGYHLGILYEFSPCTRIGLSYHSQYITRLRGRSHFVLGQSFLPSISFASSEFLLKLPLASITTLSGYHEINSRWAILASIEYMNWGIYKYDHVYREAAPFGRSIDVVNSRNFHNTLSVALGANYCYSEQLLLRAGINYFPSNVGGSNKDIVFPNPFSYSFAIGAHYQANCKLGFDVGYNYILTQTVNIHHNNFITGRLEGRRSSHGNILGLQMNYDFI